MRPWKSNPIKYLEDQLAKLAASGVTPTIIEVGSRTLLAEDLRDPGICVYAPDRPVPWVFTDIDSTRAVIRYEVHGTPAGTRLIETERQRNLWEHGDAATPLRHVTEARRVSTDSLLNRRCGALVEALRDELLLLFDDSEKDALFAFQLGRKNGETWVEAKLESNKRHQAVAVNLGADPQAEDFVTAEKDMLMMFGISR
jgi:hypothetical protein